MICFEFGKEAWVTCLMQHPLLPQNYLNVLSHVKVFLPSSFQFFASLILLNFYFFFSRSSQFSKDSNSGRSVQNESLETVRAAQELILVTKTYGCEVG